MTFKVSDPFSTKPPRLKELVDQHIMGDVWVRDTPFGSTTDSLVLAGKFGLTHGNILRSIDKCNAELSGETKYNLSKNLIESHYMAGSKGRLRRVRKVDVTEFGLILLLLYINSPKARQISAEIMYRFFILNTYLKGLTDMQIGAIKGYYRKHIKNM
ncbi:MAG: Rha family transcriptional regulator [Bdellovibrionaceae bacterium]|nr:Rha family transcriptional regulator [Pseudobdellovibrionaceae bacterium]